MYKKKAWKQSNLGVAGHTPAPPPPRGVPPLFVELNILFQYRCSLQSFVEIHIVVFKKNMKI